MPIHALHDMHLYLHQPTVVMKARVNLPAGATYPIATIPFDTVSVGAYTDVAPDSFFVIGSADGLDDRGRGRVQNVLSATNLPVGRLSRGTHDGEIDVYDNDYITFYNDFRVWAKIPFSNTDTGIDYKDSDVAVGDYLTTDMPPVANCGPGFAAYINSITSLITVAFDGTGSYAMADGATISTYAWDLQGGTVTVGTLTSSTLTATFPAGFRWVVLTVTDSNGTSHTTRCPVLAVNPAADVTIPFAIESWEKVKEGQTFNFRLLDNRLRTTYPDGCLVLFWWDAPLSPADRSHMQFIGWHQSDSFSIRATPQGLVRDTVLNCVDVAGRLAALPGFPQALQREDEDDVDEMWSLMPTLDMRKCLHYLIFWHSTAAGLADLFLSADLADYPSMRLDSTGASLYEQINSRAQSIVPDHWFVCNAKGQLSVLADWMLLDFDDRPTIVASLSEDYWASMEVTYQRPPKVYVLNSSAVISSTDWLMLGGEKTLPLAFCKAPGTAFGQGVSEATTGEKLTISQAALNACEGHRYARLNARYGLFSITEPSGTIAGDADALEPAAMLPIEVAISAATAAQRGLDFTTTRGMVKRISMRANTTPQGTWFAPTIQFEKEVIGLPAVTHVPEVPDEVDDIEVPVPWIPPVDGDERYYYDDMKGYILWDGAHVMRAWDIQASSPTWALVDTGITGTIYDGQYVFVNDTTVGMWLLTSTGVWWCGDIMATTPSWTNKLPIATVVAADAAPATGTVEFKCMYNYASEPGYLIVATGPINTDTAYLSAYFWHTHNYGASWTQVNMNGFTFGSGATERCYSKAGRFAMNIFRSDPGTIWCVRNTDRTGASTGSTAVFKSEDLGHNWSKHLIADTYTNENAGGSLLNPFPAIGDPSYIMRPSGTSGPPLLYRTTNAWTTPTTLTLPTGYDEADAPWRVNKRTFDNTHVMAWHHLTAGGATATHLLESFDQGVTWAVLHQDNGNFNTPNGWPSDVLQWAVVGSNEGGNVTTKTIRLTLNNFSTLLDKKGNLSTLLSNTWVNGLGNGFALPRLGVNI